MSDTRRQNAAVGMLGAILATTAAWWALALWPADGRTPEWVLRTRDVCFGADAESLPAPGGWLPTDRHTLQVGGRPNVFALGDATDLPLSKAGSTAHFEAPVVAERIAASVNGKGARIKEGNYEGKVICFFEIGDGKGTLLRFDYEHPPQPPTPNRVWHLGRLVFKS